MSQQYRMSHNAVLQEKETSLEQAVVGLRVEFYLLDAAQTTADPLGYISNSLICQPCLLEILFINN